MKKCSEAIGAVYLAASLVAGCGTVYVNEEDRGLEFAERTESVVELSVDNAYRKVFGHLQSCLSTHGYRIRGTINREREAASVVVDTGIGFERVLYLADSVFLRADLVRFSPERTRITFLLPTAKARPFADATLRRLVSGDGPCRT